jgi:hypothetical protein
MYNSIVDTLCKTMALACRSFRLRLKLPCLLHCVQKTHSTFHPRLYLNAEACTNGVLVSGVFVVGGNTVFGNSSGQTFSPPSNSPRWGEGSASPLAGEPALSDALSVSKGANHRFAAEGD